MLFKNHKSLIISLVFVITSAFAFAQESNYKQKEKAIYDSLTYYYYNTGLWDSVIDIGKESIYKGHDFYYLRMRMGLAYDYQGNFRLAERQYNQALAFSGNDVNAAYYQYYSAYNGGRKSAAYHYYSKYNTIQKLKVLEAKKGIGNNAVNMSEPLALAEIHTRGLSKIDFSYGYSFTGNKNHLSSFFPQQMDILYSEGIIRNTQQYFNLGLSGNISNYIEWQMAYSRNTINGYNLVQPQSSDYFTSDASIKQNDFFAKLSFFSADGWSVELSGQLLKYDNKFTDIWVDSTAYSLPGGTDSILLETPHFKEQRIKLENEDYVLGIALNRKISIVDFSLFASYASIADQNPFQIGGELTILPRGNYSLYLTNRLFYYHDDLSDRAIYKVIAGVSLTKKIFFEGAVTFGDLQYTNEPHTSIVYNWSERTNFKGDLTLVYRINNDINFSLTYMIYQKRAQYHYLKYSGLESSSEYPGYYQPTYEDKIGDNKFNQHFFVLGLSWNL